MYEPGKHIAVIGGGIGGLVTGCLLANEGFKITIIEKHSRIGGGLHSFERSGNLYESGIHYVSGFEENGVLLKLFNYLGIMDQIELMPMNDQYFDVVHVASDDKKFYIGKGKKNFVEQLSLSFPDEKENIERYINRIYEICETIPLFNLKISQSQLGYFTDEFLQPVGQFLENITSNKTLQLVLAYNSSLYGGDKESTPVYIHALVSKFYIEGATRFKGGSQQLADAMARFIESKGGTVHLNSEVVKIEIDDQKVSHLITKNGNHFKADQYISSIHPGFLMDLISPHQIQRSYRERLQNLENTYSAFIVFVGLKPNSFPFLNYNIYYFRDYDKIWGLIDYEDRAYPPGIMITTPPSASQGDYADHILLCGIMRYCDFAQWENTTVGKRGIEYKQFKEDITNRFIDLASNVFPELKSSIDHVFSSTPLTIRDYLGSKDGTLYGYKKDCQNIVKSQIMPRTKLANLFLTGQNLNLHGIIGTPLSAIVTAGEFVGIDYLVNKINNHQN